MPAAEARDASARVSGIYPAGIYLRMTTVWIGSSARR